MKIRAVCIKVKEAWYHFDFILTTTKVNTLDSSDQINVLPMPHWTEEYERSQPLVITSLKAWHAIVRGIRLENVRKKPVPIEYGVHQIPLRNITGRIVKSIIWLNWAWLVNILASMNPYDSPLYPWKNVRLYKLGVWNIIDKKT